MRGWGSAFRIARREAGRHRWRSVLVALLVLLPVFATTVGAVLWNSSQLDGQDTVERTMGAADARIRAVGGEVHQGPFPFHTWYDGAAATSEGGTPTPAPTEADLRRALGDDVRLLPVWLSSRYYGDDGSLTHYRVGDRSFDVAYRVVDLADPLARGLAILLDGDLPAADGEIAVSREMVAQGVEIGTKLQTRLRPEPFTVTGVVEDASQNSAPVIIAAPFAGQPATQQGEWLVGPAEGADPDAARIEAAQVRTLNAAGFVVASRAVAESPEGNDNHGFLYGYEDSGPASEEDVAAVVLVVTMAVIQIALLAGPAFAVTARQQARTVALMSINGATAAQARRVVLAAALLLGGTAAVVGAALGVAASHWALPIVEERSSAAWAGVQVPWGLVVLTAVAGLLAALLAAVVPAHLASRQDPVAVMNGRRSDKVSSQRTLRSALFGTALVLLGVTMMSVSVTSNGSTGMIVLMTLAVVVTTLGMVVVAPAVVALVARVAGGASFVARYTSRDAVRHRSRTVPAVAAVAATVGGVIAVGTAWSTEASRGWDDGWQPPPGQATIERNVAWWDAEAAARAESDWAGLEDTLAEVVPGADVRRTSVLFGSSHGWGHDQWFLSPATDRAALERAAARDDEAERTTDGEVEPEATFARVQEMGFGEAVVADSSEGAGLDDSVAAEVDAALAAGKVVQLLEVNAPGAAGPATLVHREVTDGVRTFDAVIEVDAVTVPAPWSDGARGSLFVPTSVAAEHDLTVVGVSAKVDGITGPEHGDRLAKAVRELDDGFYVEVERSPDYSLGETTVVLLVLAALGTLLMLIGTLSATLLALADADNDLAVLSSVGADPKARRRVAAGYALLIAGVGAVLGVVVGIVPGIAAGADMYGLGAVRLPWELMGLVVVVVPLFTAAVVGLFTRARMPVARRVA